MSPDSRIPNIGALVDDARTSVHELLEELPIDSSWRLELTRMRKNLNEVILAVNRLERMGGDTAS